MHPNITDRSSLTKLIVKDCHEMMNHAGVDTVITSIRNEFWIIGFGHRAPNWNLIVPGEPWWGGWWERMVRSVKLALKKCLGNSLVTRDELLTLLVEIENIIYSRPLTQVTDEVDN